MAKDEEVEWRRMRRLNGEGSVVNVDILGPVINILVIY